MDEMARKDKNSAYDGDALTFIKLAMALADDYESIYVINTDDDSYAEYSASGREKKLCRRSSGDDFYADTVKNCDLLVYPEDQPVFLDKFRKENVMAALRVGKSFTLNYRLVIDGVPRYYFLKTIMGTGENDNHIFIGVQNVDAQVRRERAIEEENRTYSEIAGSLASLFEVIYHIDINTGRYTEYSSSASFAELGIRSCGKDFFDLNRNAIPKILHPEDHDRIVSSMRKEALLKNLEKSGSFSTTCRIKLDGRTQYVMLVAIKQRNNCDHVVVGVRNIDEQIRRENKAAQDIATYDRIAGALASRYEVIYYIDTDSDEYEQYSASEQYTRLGIARAGEDFFNAARTDAIKYIHKEDTDRVLAALDKQALMEALKKTETMSLTYRQMLDGRVQYVTMIAVRPKNDEKRIIIGVFNVDEQIRHEQSLTQTTEAFSEIVRAMAQMYEVIYHVNINTGTYKEYSHSERYTRMEIGTTGTDFFGDTQRNMKRDIYHEDYDMMAEAMKKENLLKNMSETGSTTLNYRLLIDGKPQYVTLFATRPREDSAHIIIAVANVDSAKRREMAYRQALGSAMDMANRDALTGVKNKHAYVQMEMDMDRQISDGTCEDFAVLVADVNGLKHVNDTMGHHAGDEYIKAACKVVCTTFKHSPVFRIGGDEFAVIMKGSDFEEKDALMASLVDKMQKNSSAGLVTVAAGISYFEKGKDLRLQDVFERADTAMYENKKLYRGSRR
ncbi:GGDEF domain-containing protein [Ruminococcus sp.]|uniref:GGDEF domain-containing protein n=1 Tax=Ruminococcus sp. TaxID=41978 RepID=UPI0025CE11A4|nr:GGDEF domain-containing protein [Ruminococcus sp.]MBQ8966148.1 GGDEF domain-containing protein [Ruminococcus sp.]